MNTPIARAVILAFKLIGIFIVCSVVLAWTPMLLFALCGQGLDAPHPVWVFFAAMIVAICILSVAIENERK